MKHLHVAIAIVLMVALGVAGAATIKYSWTNATQNTDGSSIPSTGPGSITETRIEWGSCSGNAFGTKLAEVKVAGSVLTAQSADLPPGIYCSRAYHKNTYGNESGPTAVIVHTIQAPTPKPPENFSIG